jgi:hypothetical protein
MSEDWVDLFIYYLSIVYSLLHYKIIRCSPLSLSFWDQLPKHYVQRIWAHCCRVTHIGPSVGLLDKVELHSRLFGSIEEEGGDGFIA